MPDNVLGERDSLVPLGDEVTALAHFESVLAGDDQLDGDPTQDQAVHTVTSMYSDASGVDVQRVRTYYSDGSATPTEEIRNHHAPSKNFWKTLKKTLKKLTKTVVDVVRISHMKVDLPASERPRIVFGQISMHVEHPRWFCRRQTEDYGIRQTALNAEQDVNWDVRIPRSGRAQGRVFVAVKFFTMLSMGARRPSASAEFRGRVPTSSGEAEVELTLCGSGSAGAVRFASTSLKLFMTVLDANHVFNLALCRPSLREWAVPQWRELWRSPWQDGDLERREQVLETMADEMKRDVQLVWQTLFPQRPLNSLPPPPMSTEDRALLNSRVNFLKRLLFCLAICRLNFCTEQNSATFRPWPYPLASAICHGGRILIRLDGVKWRDFINLLLFGDPGWHDWEVDGVPLPFVPRWAASHAVRLKGNTSQPYEVKMTKRHTRRNIADGLLSHHLGMPLPLGGLGNPCPEVANQGELFVGPAGTPYSATGYVKDIQNGHLYLRWDDFGVTSFPVLARVSGTDDAGIRSAFAESSGPKTPAHDQSTRSCKTFTTATGTGTGSASTAICSRAVEQRSPWLQVSACRSKQDLYILVEEHGCKELASRGPGFERLYGHLTDERELSMQYRESPHKQLRCKGVLIHLLIYTGDEDGEATKILVHLAATAMPNSDSAQPCRLEDVRVPTIIRRRHESWATSVSLWCQNHFKISPAAAERMVECCRAREDEMCAYQCDGSRTVCYHHGNYGDDLKIGYEAYCFKVTLSKKDRSHFESLLMKDDFETSEQVLNLQGFGDCPSGPGQIVREWAWMSEEDAERLEVVGLHPPKDFYKIARHSDSISTVLIGIEGSAPGKRNFFSKRHGVRAKSQELSAFGKRKWRDYRAGGQEVPADIGGMHMSVDKEAFKVLQEAIAKQNLHLAERGSVLTGDQEREEMELFRELLQASDETVGHVLWNCAGLPRPEVQTAGGSQTFDAHVRGGRLPTPSGEFPATQTPSTDKTPKSRCFQAIDTTSTSSFSHVTNAQVKKRLDGSETTASKKSL